MTKEELIKFLKENLKVKVNYIHPYYDDGIGDRLRIELYLGNERIDWDEDYIN